jgi:hypothetical protein
VPLALPILIESILSKPFNSRSGSEYSCLVRRWSQVLSQYTSRRILAGGSIDMRQACPWGIVAACLTPRGRSRISSGARSAIPRSASGRAVSFVALCARAGRPFMGVRPGPAARSAAGPGAREGAASGAIARFPGRHDRTGLGVPQNGQSISLCFTKENGETCPSTRRSKNSPSCSRSRWSVIHLATGVAARPASGKR